MAHWDRRNELTRLNKILLDWLVEIKAHKDADYFDLNHDAEETARKLLSAIYGYHLENLNHRQKNFPAVDLGEKEKGFAVQVTSRRDMAAKIRETFKAWNEALTKEFPNGSRFLFLNLELESITSTQAQNLESQYPGFNYHQHVCTLDHLERGLAQAFDKGEEHFLAIRDVFAGLFPHYHLPLSPAKRLYLGARNVYRDMTGDTGRFRFLRISDMLLTRARNDDGWLDTHAATDDAQPADILDTLPLLWRQKIRHTILTGDGGMGKTVSLLRWMKEYSQEKNLTEGKPIPVFIPLNEFNHWKQMNESRKFILSKIVEDYSQAGNSLTPEEVRELLRAPRSAPESPPAIILLLDGFNEITVPDRSVLYLELRDLLEKCPSVQMVITSRYDMRETMNWKTLGVHLSRLLPLTDDQVDGYLEKNSVPPPPKVINGTKNRLRKVLRNPIMCAIYASACEIERNHRYNQNLDYKESVFSVGELLWNFMESQGAKVYDRHGGDTPVFWRYRFLMRFILPFIGYEMEKKGLFLINREELAEMVEAGCQKWDGVDFFKAFPEYAPYEAVLPCGVCPGEKASRLRQGDIIRILTDELYLLAAEEHKQSYRFQHQDFRDFFAAAHIVNVCLMAITKKELPPELTEGTLSFFVRRLWAEMEGEGIRKPKVDDKMGWVLPPLAGGVNGKKSLSGMLELCRGVFGEKPALAVWNLVTTLAEVRGELSGADLSILDLSRTPLNGVMCSRMFKERYLAADFHGSRIRGVNLFPQGHSIYVASAVYSPDGARILSASWDQTIREWSAATGELLRTFAGHESVVTSAVYSGDGARILSASSDHTIREWSAADGVLLRTFAGHDNTVTSAVYSGDNARILSASWDKTIREWSAADGVLLRTFAGHEAGVTSAVYSGDGARILSASFDHTIREWSAADGELLRTFAGHTSSVSSAVYSGDGARILSASEDKTIREWSAADGELLRTFAGHTDHVNSAVYSGDGARILSASDDQSIREWLAADGELLRTFAGHTHWVRSAVYSGDGARILSASRDKTIREWSAADGELLRTFAGHDGTVTSSVYSSDGARILSASWDKTIREWSTADGELLRTFAGHDGTVTSAVYSGDHARILSASRDKTIREWSAADGELLRTFAGHDGTVASAVYSVDGARILSASWAGEWKIWNASNGQCLATYQYNDPSIEKVKKEFKSSGSKEAYTVGNTIAIYTPSGELERKNVPGLFISGCNFRELEAGSQFTPEELDIMGYYSAGISIQKKKK